MNNVSAQPANSSAPAWSADKLLRQFSKTGNRKYRYNEQKHYSFLKKPTTSTGVLIYQAPDKLEKNISSPKVASYKIIGDKLFIQKQNKKQRKVQLSNYPEMLALADSLRAILGGKPEVLKKYFEFKLKGHKNAWVLEMTPVDIDLEDKIEEIHVSGQGSRIITIMIKETGGDKSVLTITGGW